MRSEAPSAPAPRRRIGIYLFYDEAGFVDDYVAVALRAFREQVEKLVVVCNGKPGAEGLALLRAHADEVIVRNNIGYDVWGYKEAIERIGRVELAAYDELLLLNYTFFAPIFPLGEMFGAMDALDCDFWGITAHKECRPNPLTGGEVLPLHIQSHFIAVRQPMLDSDAFWSYWREMPAIQSYTDSIQHHEMRFTEHFSSLGFSYRIYMDPDDFATVHPLCLEVDRMIERRCPILKRRPFFHDPLYMASEAINLRRALDLIAERSDYDIDLIEGNTLRTSELRTLYTNLELLDIFPDVRANPVAAPWSFGRVGVLAHVYWTDLLAEMLDYANHIPGAFDLYITTDTAQKKQAIEVQLAGFDRGTLRVDVVHSNLGRDTSALLIAQRDIVLSGRYGLLCRIHSKKSLQDGSNRGNGFKHHLLDNLLGSRGYVENIFDMIEREPRVGIVVPPTVHIGYPTLGHAWFLNKPRVEALAQLLGIHVPLDIHTPIATYGSMYWFRPAALKRLFEHHWTWAQFDEEVYGDSDLPHAIERLVTYCAQASGYATRSVFTTRQAAKNYTKLEYKHQLLASCFRSGDIRNQVLQMMFGLPPGSADAPLPANAAVEWSAPPRVRIALAGLAFAMKRSLLHRSHRLAKALRSKSNGTKVHSGRANRSDS
ncbi:MAG TPA: rhamnan synthesis F family protein [Dokdonella sp.]